MKQDWWPWLNENSGALGIVFALVPLIWAAVEFIRKTGDDRRHQRFVNYHRLIEALVDPEPGRAPKANRQLAVVFELQKYREYRQATTRILRGFREIVMSHTSKHEQLICQIDETLEVICDAY